jgi:hypothetical protein
VLKRVNARKSSPCSVSHSMYCGYPRSSTGVRAAAPTPPAGSRTHSTPRRHGALNSRPASAHVSGVTTAQLYPQQRAGEGQPQRTACNTNLSGDGGVQWRQYWYEANVRDAEMLNRVEGSFARVSNLCGALHEHLGGLSTSAATVEVFVLGPDGEYAPVAKNRLCSEAIPAVVSLAPYTPGASPLRVTYVPKAVSWRGPLSRRQPLTSQVTSNATDNCAATAPTAASPNARPTDPTERPAVLHAITFKADASMDAAMPTTIPPAPLVPLSSTKRRTVSLPPPTEREIAASALKKCRRAIKMRKTPVGAALSLEAFHDANVLGPDNSTRNFCRAVANSFLGVGETVA